MTTTPTTLPTCAVHGMIRPGALCSQVIVGMQYCGYKGECPHKREPTSTITTPPDYTAEEEEEWQRLERNRKL